VSGTDPSRLVLFDNGKVSTPYDHWAPLVAALRQGFADPVVERGDLLAEDLRRIADRARRWRADGVDGVVLMLCDAGVTVPTVLQAVAAERLGIRTVTIGTADIAGLLATAAFARADDLATLTLAVTPLDPPDTLATAAAAAVPAIRRALRGVAPPQQASYRNLWRDNGSLRDDDFATFADTVPITDGLPVDAPLRSRVAGILAPSGLDPDAVLIPEVWPSGAAVTVHDCAVATVLARGTPAALPIVMAAVRAMAHPDYRLHIAITTTHPGGHLILVSGPAADAAGISAGKGCLGPGQPANLAIGRAVNLVLQNRAAAPPGLVTLSPLGSPAQLSMCLADRAVDGFPRLAAGLVPPGDSIVVVHKTESPHNVMDHVATAPDTLARSITYGCTSPASNNAYTPSNLAVVLNPQHARVFARHGWDRSRLAAFLAEHATNPRTALAGRGSLPAWPAEWSDRAHIPVVSGPDDVIIVVAGGPGPHSMVAVPWGYAHACWATVPAAGTPMGQPRRWGRN
jgi:hypothetical protein